jgi:hypothetical protein
MLLLSGLSLLPWLAVLGLLAWAALRSWSQQRSAPQTEPALGVAGTSAAELLRLRYVLGEIDAVTFEEMLEHILASEAREDPVRRPTAARLAGLTRETNLRDEYTQL